MVTGRHRQVEARQRRRAGDRAAVFQRERHGYRGTRSHGARLRGGRDVAVQAGGNVDRGAVGEQAVGGGLLAALERVSGGVEGPGLDDGLRGRLGRGIGAEGSRDGAHGGDDPPHDEREDEDQSQTGDDAPGPQVHGRASTARRGLRGPTRACPAPPLSRRGSGGRRRARRSSPTARCGTGGAVACAPGCGRGATGGGSPGGILTLVSHASTIPAHDIGARLTLGARSLSRARGLPHEALKRRRCAYASSTIHRRRGRSRTSVPRRERRRSRRDRPGR